MKGFTSVTENNSKRKLTIGHRIGLALLRLYGRMICRPLYHGKENIPNAGPFILIGNHQSFFDVMLIHLEMPQHVRWVAKDDLLGIPLLNGFIKGMGTIFVDRAGVNLSAIKTIFSSLKEGDIVGLFPEATRIRGKEIGEVMPKDAVINLLSRVEVPIVPFAINVPYKPFRLNHVYFGKPFYLSRKDAKDIHSTKLLVMQKIYELQGPLPRKLIEGNAHGNREG